MVYEVKWTITQDHDGMTIRDYLQTIRGFSRSMLKVVKFDGGNIEVNGYSQSVRYTISEGDLVTVQFPKEVIGNGMKAEDLELDIRYEDEALIILNKPAGMAILPSVNHPSGTIANGLLGYYKRNKISYTIHVVTRLDRDTSGLVLIAKHRFSHSLLFSSQKKGAVKRKYKAVIEGHLDKKQGIINQPIARKGNSIIERTVADAGKEAITHYNVIQESTNHSLVEIELETGRTHQIRVHFTHLGHPIAGDDLYGGSTDKVAQQALHCFALQFEHPYTMEEMQFHSPLRTDIKQLIST
ncbi:23S rRNA pseudouridine1911/1915/1917 synthase [Virgibacillus natechei]|uniref:Pseudouridine synthase n=1 Tax=Virgibacillus natechei TaxID=1216297 RepID=A0ABS4IDX3_9BACI|nr:RluA family pseudouridine synthase [Virgibacillus natechei]MBP1969053.1 23S rRNA pseudouridine1911/1915/1917 synthase [Virgibacillus natechei]UZD14323.1 RluA family pseudouridine synthase [Virgibacillus natechei]